jgi:hypothetical protein
MSGFDFDEVGEFGSDIDADNWAREHNLDPSDVDVRTQANGRKRVWVRRGSTRMSDIELRNSRNRGFLR